MFSNDTHSFFNVFLGSEGVCTDLQSQKNDDSDVGPSKFSKSQPRINTYSAGLCSCSLLFGTSLNTKIFDKKLAELNKSSNFKYQLPNEFYR